MTVVYNELVKEEGKEKERGRQEGLLLAQMSTNLFSPCDSRGKGSGSDKSERS